ncbi:hypothetical protein BBJ28_00017363 [Nothophytophthora sp. Chile5]|nr:hypothetical protein BBJ28_00017363 [Nothophytophthora sp. Chile5]
MKPAVSVASVALAMAVLAAGVPGGLNVMVTDARPMHAGIVHLYDRYLAEKEDVSAELDDWLSNYGPSGPKNGWMPVTESRSADDALEDQRQRFFLTKQQIAQAQAANPDAHFGTDGPFTLMTQEEFAAFVSNAHLSGNSTAIAAMTTTPTATPVPTTRQLRSAGSHHHYKGQWSFGDLSPNDVAQIASAVSANTGSDTTYSSTATGSSSTPEGSSWHRSWGKSWGTNSDGTSWSKFWGSTDTPTTESPAKQSTVTTAPTPDTETPSETSADSAKQSPITDAPTTAAPTQAPTTAPPTTAPTTAPPTQAPTTQAPTTQAPVTEEATSSTTASDSDSVDWSTSACVNPPRMQGQCGSCWAFATVGAVEAAQCIANGDSSAATYSEQQLVSCDSQNYGCNGGAPVYAMEYVRDTGLCSGSDYTYTSDEGSVASCSSSSCSKAQTGIKGYVQIDAGDESGLISAVQTHPVIVAVASSNNAWKQYQGGVISSCETTEVDHAVLVVGYDATTLKIKNSWSTDWGEDGYVRMSRSTNGNGVCEVLSDMSHPDI